ncbi:RxLR effector protein [Phytophthora megakarya]|uniref:RxLR effector protein n=1 Tax=Phytophthora megakarya TaxID=4795 RepID=A0A225WQ43_9STRA|nr:RxLR effector protein [Phytophthora megakarya]
MRLSYVALAVAATLLANAMALTPEGEVNRVPQTTSKIFGAVEISDIGKRMLRGHDEEGDPVESLDNDEERTGKGISAQDVLHLVKAKGKAIPVEMEKMNKRFQKQVIGILREQDLTKKMFATKLGLKGTTDQNARNYGWFVKNMENFRQGKKPKKIPGNFIGGR